MKLIDGFKFRLIDHGDTYGQNQECRHSTKSHGIEIITPANEYLPIVLHDLFLLKQSTANITVPESTFQKYLKTLNN